VALVAAAFLCTHAVVDPDLWGHLRFGLDALRDGRLASIDPYSFTQDAGWINHEWLSEVALAIAYRAGAVVGLLLLKTVLLAGTVALLWRASRAVREPYRWWMIAAAIVGMAPAAYTMRPQLWTLLFVPIVWAALERRTRLVAVPLLFALWANLHGGWIVGAAVAALWTLGRAIDSRSVRAILPETAAIAAGVLATLVNPYGARLWTFLLSTVRLSRNISEWQPVWRQADPTSGLLWAVVAIAIAVSPLLRDRSRLTWAGLLPVAWLGVLSLFVARLVPLFAETALLGIAALAVRRSGGFADVRDDFAAVRAGVADVRRSSFDARLAIDAIAVAAVALVNLVPQSRCLPIREPWAPDLAAASAFESPDVRGRLVLPFNWGEYAIWHWAPRLRVSIDGRRETVYSERTIGIAASVAHGLPDGLDFVRQARPEYVWLARPTGAAAEGWLRASGYRIDVDTPASFIATRADVQPLAASAGMSHCFP
jgi:hypothetical protein